MKKLTPEFAAQPMSCVNVFEGPIKELTTRIEEDSLEFVRLQELSKSKDLSEEALGLILDKMELLIARDTLATTMLAAIMPLTKKVAKFNLGAESINRIDAELEELNRAEKVS